MIENSGAIVQTFKKNLLKTSSIYPRLFRDVFADETHSFTVSHNMPAVMNWQTSQFLAGGELD
jgi:hypothetical protein